jgi:tRNA(Ser,Leu) C12 N-acetylase TAN1
MLYCHDHKVRRKGSAFHHIPRISSKILNCDIADALKRRLEDDPSSLSFLSRLIPVTKSFIFQTPDEFERKVKETVSEWVPQLEGKGFHVRMHRRGFKVRLSSLEEEKMLDEFLLELAKDRGNPGHVTFEGPDVIIAVETVAHRDC